MAWLSMLLFAAYTGVELGIGQWAFPLLVSARGLGTVEAGAAGSTYWAPLTLGRFFFGGVVAAIGVQRLLQACVLGVVLGLTLLWAPTVPWLAFAALAVLGVVQAPVYPALVTLTPSQFGSTHTANAVGFQVAAGVVGGAGLPALMGSWPKGSDSKPSCRCWSQRRRCRSGVTSQGRAPIAAERVAQPHQAGSLTYRHGPGHRLPELKKC